MSDNDGTPVRCLDCGHEWETVAEYPQCSDPNDECGRSRNVEPIAEIEGGDGGMSERDPEPSGDSQAEGGWSPVFETQEEETETVEDMSFSEEPEIEDHDLGFGAGDTDSDPGGDSDPDEGAEPSPPQLEPEDIEFFVKTPFDMAAKSRGDHWELGEDELTQLSHAYCRVGNKYLPYMMAEHAPEVMAALTTMAVVGPRLAEDKANEEQEQKEQKRERDAPQEASDRRSDSPAEAQNNITSAYSRV